MDARIKPHPTQQNTLSTQLRVRMVSHTLIEFCSRIFACTTLITWSVNTSISWTFDSKPLISLDPSNPWIEKKIRNNILKRIASVDLQVLVDMPHRSVRQYWPYLQKCRVGCHHLQISLVVFYSMHLFTWNEKETWEWGSYNMNFFS